MTRDRNAIIKSILLVLAFACLSACQSAAINNREIARSPANSKPSSLSSDRQDQAELENFLRTAAELAARADKEIVDGWICGQYSRALKSGYLGVSPEDKAKFAYQYYRMIDKSGQNLAMSLDSYVSFDNRLEFAFRWWQNSDYKDKFDKQKPNKKLLWLYESILDGGELFWRAFEILHPEMINSAATLAHYKEQDMVFNYMSDPTSASNFSEVYRRWKTRLGAKDSKTTQVDRTRNDRATR